MSLSVKGTIKQKLELEQGTSKAGKEWKSQSFVLNTGAQYNPDICFKLFGEDIRELKYYCRRWRRFLWRMMRVRLFFCFLVNSFRRPANGFSESRKSIKTGFPMRSRRSLNPFSR